MTNSQVSTAKRIVSDYIELAEKNSRKYIVNGIEHSWSRLSIDLRSYYKNIENGKTLFGMGTGSVVSDSYVITIRVFNIIMSNGEVLNKSDYNDSELELTKDIIEIDMFNMREDLIPFNDKK
jgi:hypothetical protein